MFSVTSRSLYSFDISCFRNDCRHLFTLILFLFIPIPHTYILWISFREFFYVFHSFLYCLLDTLVGIHLRQYNDNNNNSNNDDDDDSFCFNIHLTLSICAVWCCYRFGNNVISFLFLTQQCHFFSVSIMLILLYHYAHFWFRDKI